MRSFRGNTGHRSRGVALTLGGPGHGCRVAVIAPSHKHHHGIGFDVHISMNREISVRAGRPSSWYWRGPYRRQVSEASNVHAMRQPAIDRRLDETGEGSQRDCHVDPSRTAVFALGDASALAVESAMSSLSQRGRGQWMPLISPASSDASGARRVRRGSPDSPEFL
jgi:hypothetical protein